LWIYVNLIISPTIKRALKIPVEYKNAPLLMRITPESLDADVVLTGTRRNFIFTSKDSIQASIDLYYLRPGPAKMQLRVSPPSGFMVDSVTPAQLDIHGESLIRKEFEVTAEVKGQTSEGFIADTPIVTPRKVVVEGPKETIDKIVSCQVAVLFSDIKNSFSESMKVTVFGPDGEMTDNFRVLPEKVNIDITVKAGYPSKVIPVATPQFINKAPEGYKLEGFTIIPPEVTISGPPRVIEQMSEISLLPIDLEQLYPGASIAAVLKPSFESIKIVGSTTVSVIVSMSSAKIVRPFLGLPLTLKNSTQQHCIVSPSSCTLVLKGYVEDLNKVSSADLAILLDTREMPTGSFSVLLPAPEGLSERIEIVEIQPAKVNIEVSELRKDTLASPTIDPAPISQE